MLELFVHVPQRELLVASRQGYGFVVPEAQLLGTLRRGRKTLNLGEGDEACVCVPFTGDRVVVLGENRKLLIFDSAALPVRSRARGVRLQRYAQKGLADAKVFEAAQGLEIGSKVFTDLEPWRGARAQAGRMAPKGFPKTLGHKF